MARAYGAPKTAEILNDIGKHWDRTVEEGETPETPADIAFLVANGLDGPILIKKENP